MTSELFTGRLLPGERIIWSGQPQQGLLLTARDIFLIPFSLMWCGFAIVWTFMVASASVSEANAAAEVNGAAGFFILWGLMFVAVGLYFVAGRFVVDAWVRRGLHYAVTDQRILIARGAPFARFTVLSMAKLPEIDLNERGNGRGTIRFGQPVATRSNRGTGALAVALDPTPQFLGIEDARRVFDLIQRAQAG